MIVNNRKTQQTHETVGNFQRSISFYDEPPQETIGIYEFHNIAVSRLQVLKKIQFLYDSNKDKEGADVMAKEINKYSRQHRLNVEGLFNPKEKGFEYTHDKNAPEAHKNDSISHFICRLAYCRTDDLRKWFVQQETRLFYHRLASYEPKHVLEVLKNQCAMNYAQLSPEDPEWKKFKSFITFNHGERAQAEDFIKVPFKDALSLVQQRQVFLHLGTAFVHISDLNSIARAQFRAKLSGELAKAFKYLKQIFKDERISQLLINLSNHNSIDFNLTEVTAPKDTDKIRLADLDFYSRKSFPPCMKGLFTALKNQHHLKHFGRLQLGLYLKGLGFTVDEALMFWKAEFCKKMDTDKFEKNYAYNIRHMYGQEGKKNDYKPWNCMKVINQQAPGSGEYHGCPFKTFSDQNVKQLVGTYGLNASETQIVMDKKKDNLYQVACLRLFELSHKGSVADNVGNHPNSFFNSSVEYIKDMEKKPGNKPAPAQGGAAKAEAPAAATEEAPAAKEAPAKKEEA